LRLELLLRTIRPNRQPRIARGVYAGMQSEEGLRKENRTCLHAEKLYKPYKEVRFDDVTGAWVICRLNTPKNAEIDTWIDTSYDWS
jgi:hypothetical protein